MIILLIKLSFNLFLPFTVLHEKWQPLLTNTLQAGKHGEWKRSNCSLASGGYSFTFTNGNTWIFHTWGEYFKAYLQYCLHINSSIVFVFYQWNMIQTRLNLNLLGFNLFYVANAKAQGDVWKTKICILVCYFIFMVCIALPILAGSCRMGI